MKMNITKIGAALLAVGICITTEMRAQTTTTVTTTKGAFTEFVPGSRNGCRENGNEPGSVALCGNQTNDDR